MGKLRLQITVTLDAYVAGPNQSVENPLGEGGGRIHEWVFNQKTFREMLGLGSGGETGVNDDVIREAFDNVSATIMGRNMFDGGPGVAHLKCRVLGPAGEPSGHAPRESSPVPGGL